MTPDLAETTMRTLSAARMPSLIPTMVVPYVEDHKVVCYIDLLDDRAFSYAGSHGGGHRDLPANLLLVAVADGVSIGGLSQTVGRIYYIPFQGKMQALPEKFSKEIERKGGAV